MKKLQRKNRLKQQHQQYQHHRRRKKQRRLHVPKHLEYRRSYQVLIRGKENLSQRTCLAGGQRTAAGLQASESGYLTNRHYEMLYKFLGPRLKNKDPDNPLTNLVVRLYTDGRLTSKPQQARMGRGKGQPSNVWYGRVYSGQLLVEVKSIISPWRARAALQYIRKKLPIRTRLIQCTNRAEGRVDPNSAYYFTIYTKKKYPFDKPPTKPIKLLPYIK